MDWHRELDEFLYKDYNDKKGAIMNTFYGADVSEYQGSINWAAFNPGAAFVFIKAGGGDDGLYLDAQFEANKVGVRSLGSQMPHGYYWFGGSNDATQEATYFVNNCVQDLQVGEALVLDSESGSALSPSWCLEWLNAVQNMTGVKPLIYMSASKTTSQDWSQVVSGDYGLWVADYAVSPADDVAIGHWSLYAFHQYADNGTFPGISGNVDCDAFFAPAITDFLKYGKQPEAVVAPPLAPAPSPVDSTVSSTPSEPPTPPTTPTEPVSTTGDTSTTPSPTTPSTGTSIDGIIPPKKPTSTSPVETKPTESEITVIENEVQNWFIRFIKWLTS